MYALVYCSHFDFGVFLVSGISNAEARQPGKAPNFSVNWTVGDQALEVINATTGKDDMGRASRLCKHALYSRWVRLHSKVNIPLKSVLLIYVLFIMVEHEVS